MKVQQVETATGEVNSGPPPAPTTTKRKRSIIIFSIVSAINVGLLIFLWTQLLTPAQLVGQNSDPLIGHAAPNFTLSLLSSHSNGQLSLVDFKGKPMVINFWSSTCAPCIAEAPLLQTQWKQAQTKGVVFIGIDYEDTRSDGLGFLKQYGITYPNVLDAKGDVAVNYGITGTPETLFVNRQGIIVSRVAQELTPTTLQSNLKLIM
jgi:cytochrome c biogenesis protein CcmG/thiol:disulfide interchange protein DsbE